MIITEERMFIKLLKLGDSLKTIEIKYWIKNQFMSKFFYINILISVLWLVILKLKW